MTHTGENFIEREDNVIEFPGIPTYSVEGLSAEEAERLLGETNGARKFIYDAWVAGENQKAKTEAGASFVGEAFAAAPEAESDE